MICRLRKTPYEHMLDLMPEATEAQRRAKLGTLGFGVGKADTKAENLSGGEKARLLFAWRRSTRHTC